jgi:hypothetical protein
LLHNVRVSKKEIIMTEYDAQNPKVKTEIETAALVEFGESHTRDGDEFFSASGMRVGYLGRDLDGDLVLVDFSGDVDRMVAYFPQT